MSKDIRRVVVVLQIEVLHHSGRDLFAARFKQLGLTAYGQTEDDAVDSLKKMFNKFVRYHRDGGRLEDRLDRSGVDWHWVDEYPSDKPEYEDTNVLVGTIPPSQPVMPQNPSWSSASVIRRPNRAVLA